MNGAYVLSTDLVRVNIERRRRAEANGEWRERYAVRAGIEGTNSELKRRHGLGHLRVRGAPFSGNSTLVQELAPLSISRVF